MDNKYLYTPKEVAEKFGVSRSIVNKWLREGQLQGFRVGNMWKVTEEALSEFIKKSTGE